MSREIIFESIVGSHLYGTNRPDSDMDYLGVFIPSLDEIISLENPSEEWTMNTKLSDSAKNTKDDIDRKYFSLKKFINLLGQGQSGPLELLFAPQSMVIKSSPIWNEIKANRTLFISQQSITPILGFATAQAHRATLSANNYNLINKVLYFLGLSNIKSSQSINDYIVCIDLNVMQCQVFGEMIKYWKDQNEIEHITIAGRSWPTTASVMLMYKHLKELLDKYGNRSKQAAVDGFDYKSLCHAYRLLGEAKELKATGIITLPRPKSEVQFLLDVRNGRYQADYFEELESGIQEAKSMPSSLPEKVDWKKIGAFYKEICYKYYGVK